MPVDKCRSTGIFHIGLIFGRRIRKSKLRQFNRHGGTHQTSRRSSGYLSLLSFWRKWAQEAPTNRLQLVWENPPTESGQLKTALEKKKWKYRCFTQECPWCNGFLTFSCNLLLPFDLQTCLHLTRTICQPLVVEYPRWSQNSKKPKGKIAVVRFAKKKKNDIGSTRAFSYDVASGAGLTRPKLVSAS